MTIVDVMTAPWAILPEKLEAIFGIFERHVGGVKLSEDELAARIGPFQTERASMLVDDGVATIPIVGTIAKRANLFSKFSGGTSTEAIRAEFREALANDEVLSILFVIDSPGGTVSGTQELAQEIFEARGQKPMTAFTDGMMASAAYWIGAAADEIVISGDTTQVGSIGVVAKHIDRSRQNEMLGIRESEIVAGKFKRAASSLGPLTETGFHIIQSTVDHLYQAFVRDIAMFRGVSEDEVLANMADGRIFMGMQAITAGLADRQASLTTVLHRAAHQQGVIVMSGKTLESTQPSVDLEAIKQDSFAAGLKQGLEAGKKDGFESGLKEGAAKERARIQGIEQLALKGHDELIAKAKFDGASTPEQVAVQVIHAQKSLQDKQLESLYAGAEAPVPADTPKPEQAKGTTQADIDAFIAAHTQGGGTYKAALIAAEKHYPEFFKRQRLAG